MDRRTLFGALGAAGAGVALGGANVLAHGEKKTDDKFMAPVENQHMFFCGFHIAKKNPQLQMTAVHYCGMRGEGEYAMHQCLLYDSVGKGAKLLGVEYIVSDKLFQSLPEEEKKYWHPHTYEVLSGGLVAPAMSEEDETKFMKALLTTW